MSHLEQARKRLQQQAEKTARGEAEAERSKQIAEQRRIAEVEQLFQTTVEPLLNAEHQALIEARVPGELKELFEEALREVEKQLKRDGIREPLTRRRTFYHEGYEYSEGAIDFWMKEKLVGLYEEDILLERLKRVDIKFEVPTTGSSFGYEVADNGEISGYSQGEYWDHSFGVYSEVQQFAEELVQYTDGKRWLVKGSPPIKEDHWDGR